jgi:hypothetical protein
MLRRNTMIKTGIRTIKIIRANKARLYGNWYSELIGHEFDTIMYDICAAEYTVKYVDQLCLLPENDVVIVIETKGDSV